MRPEPIIFVGIILGLVFYYYRGMKSNKSAWLRILFSLIRVLMLGLVLPMAIFLDSVLEASENQMLFFIAISGGFIVYLGSLLFEENHDS